MKRHLAPADLAARCRCQDPEGRQWIYLNAFCPYRDQHLPWDDYGFCHRGIMLAAAHYHQTWLAGELNDDIPAEARPGYRPPRAPHVE